MRVSRVGPVAGSGVRTAFGCAELGCAASFLVRLAALSGRAVAARAGAPAGGCAGRTDATDFVTIRDTSTHIERRAANDSARLGAGNAEPCDGNMYVPRRSSATAPLPIADAVLSVVPLAGDTSPRVRSAVKRTSDGVTKPLIERRRKVDCTDSTVAVTVRLETPMTSPPGVPRSAVPARTVTLSPRRTACAWPSVGQLHHSATMTPVHHQPRVSLKADGVCVNGCDELIGWSGCAGWVHFARTGSE